MIVYDKAGRLVHKWTKGWAGAHGLSIVAEGAREVLFVTDLGSHRDAGKLVPMKNDGGVFLHPHDVVVDDEGSVYVAQFASARTYPIKLERA